MSLQRRWAPLPLLLGACYMTGAQSINLGPFHFTVLRILLLLGFIRTRVRGERISGGFTGLDRLILAWGAWFIIAASFHQPYGEALVLRLGAVYNVIGIYFLIRIFCQTTEDVVQIVKITAIILVPVGIEMINEKMTHRNVFGLLGGVPIEVLERDDKFRAQGPFGHPILAGTVGGLCFPLIIGIWQRHKSIAKIGLLACAAMVLASTSSGPLMTVAFSAFALLLWLRRSLIAKLRVLAVILYFICNMIMTRPAYYLLEKIDLTGSSAGYHRAAIIEAGINHLNEWWLGGTDYTRHWMPYGVSYSPNHVDITNHYLWYGVDGGLPLMILLILMVWLGFRYIGQTMKLMLTSPKDEQFLVWCVGTGLFAHATTMVSVAYFDQSVMFLYMNLAVIASIRSYATGVSGAKTVDPMRIDRGRGWQTARPVQPEPASG